MNALLLAIVISGGDGRSITNATSLVDRDWVAVVTKQETNRNGLVVRQTTSRIVLSLRPREAWDSGKAWVFRIPEKGSLVAWKGYYSFFADGDDEDNMILSLRITREYEGNFTSSGIQWKLQSNWESTGVYADLPTVNGAVPKRLTVTPRRAFYVDAKGKFTRRYYQPSGILDAIRYGRQEETPYSADFLPLDDTYRFTTSGVDTALKRLLTDPPSYVPRGG